MADSRTELARYSLQHSLPAEVQYQIITHLDPVGFISLSQSSRYFRYLLQPGKKEFAERLLVIECLEKYGGGTSLFYTTPPSQVKHYERHGRDIGLMYKGLRDQVELYRTLGPWEANLWACTSCLRLLPHSHFDNRSLLRLKYRKPVPGTPAADIATTWVPSLYGQNSGRKARLITKEKELVAKRGNIGPTPVSERCGFNRRKRRCNECRFQAKLLGPYCSRYFLPRSREHGYLGGTKTVPIVRSRQLHLDSVFVRYFPRLERVLECKPPPFPPRVYRVVAWDKEKETWGLYMVRCPGCEKWQELRAFRFGGKRINWKPTHNGDGRVAINRLSEVANNYMKHATEYLSLEDIRCNHCFSREHGNEALAEALLREFLDTIRYPMCGIARRLKIQSPDFGILYSGHPSYPSPPNDDSLADYEELLRLARRAEERNRLHKPLTHGDVEILRKDASEVKSAWERLKKSNPRLASQVGDRRYFLLWLNNFEQSEAVWNWLMACKAEVTENPKLLVEWALTCDDPSSCY